MENKLIAQLQATLPSGMVLPTELMQLYQWIEDNGYYVDTADGRRFGCLYPQQELKDSWTDSTRDGGTMIEFLTEDVANLKYWFGGNESEDITKRLCVFAQSGAEGSQCALWLSDNGEVKVVHMGSGSGSILSCVLADNFVDFLRLLAIGYDEICWNENFGTAPSEIEDDLIIQPNVRFQNWVCDTFNVKIPTTALEIVKTVATMDDDDSDDAFFKWYMPMVI